MRNYERMKMMTHDVASQKRRQLFWDGRGRAIWRRLVGCAILLLVPIHGLVRNARAEEMKVIPLRSTAALPAPSGSKQQFATEKFGQVSIPELSLARKIDASESSLEAVRQHAKSFDFYLVPLKFGVLGLDGKSCKWIQFGASLKSIEAEAPQSFIINVFPATSLKKGSIGADGTLTVSSDLKIEAPGPIASGGLGVGGSAKISWAWSPLYEQVVVIYDQTRAMWKFNAVGSEFPTGEIEVGAIIAVAKAMAKPSTKIDFDVEIQASFGGGWFDAGGLAHANSNVIASLP